MTAVRVGLRRRDGRRPPHGVTRGGNRIRLTVRLLPHPRHLGEGTPTRSGPRCHGRRRQYNVRVRRRRTTERGCTVDTTRYTAIVADESARFLSALRRADLGRVVPSTPGWRAADLAWHDLATVRVGGAAASPRLLIPIVEMYQRVDGGITVPEALRPYFGAEQITPRP